MAGDNPNFPIGTAVVNWTDSGGTFHLRVYSTDGYTVTERCADGSSGEWATGSFSQPGSAVSATVWTDQSGAHVRVYCTTEDDTTEWCTDPNVVWYKGGYTTT